MRANVCALYSREADIGLSIDSVLSAPIPAQLSNDWSDKGGANRANVLTCAPLDTGNRIPQWQLAKSVSPDQRRFRSAGAF